MSAQIATARHTSSAVKTRKRILTGDRPTAKSFHLGNYYGTLQNRVKLQDEYDSFFLIADYHMLTTRVTDLEEIGQNIRELVTDYLAVGIDPERSTIYLQSLIPEVTELFLYFSMLVTVPRAQRIPTLKDQMRDHNLAVPTYGLLGYPILQAADILMVKGDLVPVGRDQESHVELTREIARRFNELFGAVFPVPEALIPEGGMLPGIDGAGKMGKSLGNAIFLTDDPKTVEDTRPRRGQSGLRLPRRLQPGQGGGRGLQTPLSRRQDRRRRGQAPPGRRGRGLFAADPRAQSPVRSRPVGRGSDHQGRQREGTRRSTPHFARRATGHAPRLLRPLGSACRGFMS